MGRKKKQKIIKVEEKQPIVYSGRVVLKTIKNNKIVSTSVHHNKGKEPLFDFLLTCLAGKFDKTLRPVYVTPIIKGNKEDVYMYATNQEIPFINNIDFYTQSESSATTDRYIEYNFYLPSKYDYQTTGIDGLALYCEKYKPDAQKDIVKGKEIAEDYSMIVLFDETKKLEENEGLIVLWQLSVSNISN